MDSSVPRRGLPIWLFLLGSLGAVLGFAWSDKDYVAATTVGVMAACGLWGYRYGALRQLGAVCAFAGAYKLAPLAAPWLAARIHGSITNSPALTQLLSVGVASLTIVISLMYLTKSFSRRWSAKDVGFESSNQLLGFGMGATQGALFVLIVLSGAVCAAPMAHERLRQPATGGHEALARVISQQIVDLAQQADRSSMAHLIEQYNPFENVPRLKQMQRRVAAIQDPQVFARISNHPAVVKLQSKASVRAAMDSLANDPELRQIAMSGKPMSGQTALSLLDNPAIAKLLTQPELLRDIAEALAEFDQSELSSLAAGPGGESNSHAN